MNVNHNKLIYPDRINGILFTVHNELGRYCNENQYADAIEEKFRRLNINYKREETIPPSFSGEIKGRNRVDFIVENKIILEVKSTRLLSREMYYQVRRYLNAFNIKLAILVNFRDKYLKPRRILNSSVDI